MHIGLRTTRLDPEKRSESVSLVRVCGVWLLTLFLAAGCAHSVAQSDSGELPRRSDVITRADIERTDAATVLDAVRLIRRHWISPARIRGQAPIRVYVDNVLRGGLQELRFIQSNHIAVIRYFNARDATTRWGTDHSGGVILVELQIADW